MKKLNDIAYLIEKEEDLTSVSLPEKIDVTYADIESTSFKDDEAAFFPYQGHRIFGIALSWDDLPFAYYLPVRHKLGRNLDVEVVMNFMTKVFSRADKWANHNIKFDKHFFAVDGVVPDCEMLDTLSYSMMLDSERFNHQLKSLVPDWCGYQMGEEEEVKTYLKAIQWHDGKKKRRGTKDYAHLPIEMSARYACKDVIGNKLLMKYIDRNRYDALAWNLETAFTKTMWGVENRGQVVDPLQLKKEHVVSLVKLIGIETKISSIVGKEFNDHETWYSDVLLTQFGLPPFYKRKRIKDNWTNSLSFDKEALAFYSAHPLTLKDPDLTELIKLIGEHRSETTYKGTFVEALLSLHDGDNLVHPSYRLIRTGRLACSKPNSQQQNKRTKLLFPCRPGRAFFTADADQIEFRIIVHYIQDERAIQAYIDDPYTDWHMWCANLCHVERDPAKTLNFAMAYGAGEQRVINGLSRDPSIIAEVSSQLADSGLTGRELAREFKHLSEEHCKMVYRRYHERLPGIRTKSKLARNSASVRGHVFNAYGRRRHLGRRGGHKAFNSVVQGSAMDFIKERMVQADNDPFLLSNDVRVAWNVHDEVGFEGPDEFLKVEEHQQYLVDLLAEQYLVKFRVPLTWSGGYSNNNWSEAATCANGKVVSCLK